MKMPRGWSAVSSDNSLTIKPRPQTTGSEVSARKKEVIARIDMSEEIAGAGLCPACKQPMHRMFANGFPVLCCMDDRIVLPVKTENI